MMPAKALFEYMRRTGELLDEQDVNEPSVAYHFEDGHERCGEANDFLNMISRDTFFYPLGLRARYLRHAFLNGKNEEGALCQARDILAWLVNQEQAAGVRSPEFQQILEQVDVHYSYSDAEHIDQTIEANRYLGQEYDAVRIVRHQERKPKEKSTRVLRS
jgi:hypothetical protein